MNWTLSVLCLALFFVENGLSKLTPDFIHPCKIDDNPCILQSARDALPQFSKGLPELGVPSLDPFYVAKISIPLAGLNLTFSNGNVTGFRKAVIEKVESNIQKQKFFIQFRCNVTLKGAYEAAGRILTFPINGDGDAKIKITNLRMKVKINTNAVKDDKGVNHMAMKDYESEYDYGDKTVYHLTNFFKGNPELSRTMVQFLNANWRLVAQEFGKPVFDYATEVALRSIEKFFLHVPVEELIDGTIPSDILDRYTVPLN